MLMFLNFARITFLLFNILEINFQILRILNQKKIFKKLK